ncbi:MAG: 50S ribosomal protein L18 [Candidatus Paceibacterota bacterium]
MQTTLFKKQRRQRRIRAKISGTEERPRLAVFRSNKHIYAQLIDDTKGVTLVSASDKRKTEKKALKESAHDVGVELAKKAEAKKITNIVFDRGGFSYTGSVAALAEGARKGGLIF